MFKGRYQALKEPMSFSIIFTSSDTLNVCICLQTFMPKNGKQWLVFKAVYDGGSIELEGKLISLNTEYILHALKLLRGNNDKITKKIQKK